MRIAVEYDELVDQVVLALLFRDPANIVGSGPGKHDEADLKAVWVAHEEVLAIDPRCQND